MSRSESVVQVEMPCRKIVSSISQVGVERDARRDATRTGAVVGSRNLKYIHPELEGLMHRGTALVELGCGEGRSLDELGRHYRVAAGIDFNPKRIEARSERRENWKLVIGDLNCGVPIRSSSVDVVFSNQVIEHLSDPKYFAAEIYRVLRPRGVALVTTPNLRYARHLWRLVALGRGPKTSCPPCDLDGPWDDGHIHYFTHRDMREIFCRVGFSSVESRALIDDNGQLSGLRRFFARISGAFIVREFLSGCILLVASK